MPQKWEYKVIENKDRKTLLGELNKAGGEGWELVSQTSTFNVAAYLILKRPLP